MKPFIPFLFLLLATTLEVSGDALVRIGIFNHIGWARAGIMLAGACLLLGYGGVFLMTLALGAIVTSILASWIRGSHLSGADRSLGGGFGLLRAVLMIGAAALLSDLAEAREARWWTESQLIDKFDAVGDAIGALLPESWLDALRPEAVSGAQMEN